MATILAIDQGTTNSKVLLVSADDGRVLARASRPVAISHPRAGWTEQSGDAIWDSVAGAIADIGTQMALESVAAVAIANQRETIMLWDAATGDPVAPAISWQCLRSTPLCARLRAEGHEAAVIESTGLGLDPLFPSGKLAWLLDNSDGLRQRAQAGELRAGTIDSWLVWRLGGGALHAIDVSNASRTQLLSIDRLEWDPAMLALFGIPAAILPEVRRSDAGFGVTASGTALPAGIPIAAVLGDSHAALFGHCLGLPDAVPNAVKVTCGTGSSLMAATPARPVSRHGLASTIAWGRGDDVRYALEGNVAVSGHAAAFAVRLLGLADETALTRLAETVPDSGGLTFVPALAGLGAPHWKEDARGLLRGLSLASEPGHVARAVFEGIALQIGDMFEAVARDLGETPSALSVDGGASRNDLLMQLLADVVDRPVLRPVQAEIGAIGIAGLAAAAVGLADGPWTHAPPDRFLPAMPAERRTALIEGWRIAVTQAAAA